LSETSIHPTAIVDRSVHLGEGVKVGAFSIIGPETVLGDRVAIGAHVELGAQNPLDASPPSKNSDGPIHIGADCVVGSQVIVSGQVDVGAHVRVGHGTILSGPMTIGKGSNIFDLTVVGGAGQYPGNHRFDGRIEIGENVTVRELVLIHKPVLTASTVIEDGCYLMSRTQIDHDCHLERRVKTACGVTLGGSVHIGEFAYLGMNAVVHQGIHVGAHTMVGMNSAVTKHVPPFAMLVKNAFTKINRSGLELRRMSSAQIAAIEAFYTASTPLAQNSGEKDAALRLIEAFYSATKGAPVFKPEFSRKD
jgi:UDP-N-acetylglucosamine acyltransferase